MLNPDIGAECVPGQSNGSAFEGSSADPCGDGINALVLQHPPRDSVRHQLNKPLRVMKFGGTSVADASCMQKVVEIIQAGSSEAKLVVVVSAMSGVTNKLIEAATQSEAGASTAVEAIFGELWQRHDEVVKVLIHLPAERIRIGRKMKQLFRECERLCRTAILQRELTLRVRDSILSLGERFSAVLLAAALVEQGVAGESVDATELVVTDSEHGAAAPRIDLTRIRCQARLQPLLQRGIVPVVTGFIGATVDGVLTTLGRNSSDYSATIVGAALDADEVVIWTDVDGVLTADPRQLPDARCIPEISYREAAELAFFGAKVLHPKTLRAVMQSGIPVWIRNTFAPERPGTKITIMGPSNPAGVKGLTSISDVASITVCGPGISALADVVQRTFVAAMAVRPDMLLVCQSPSQNDICFVVSASVAPRTVEMLRREFSQELAAEQIQCIALDPAVAIVTVVGQNIRGVSGISGRTFGALDRANVKIMALTQGSSERNISFVLKQKDVKTAVIALHHEFELGSLNSPALSVPSNGTGSTRREPVGHQPENSWHTEDH